MLCTIIRVVEPISSSLLGETLPSHAVFTSACPRRHRAARRGETLVLDVRTSVMSLADQPANATGVATLMWLLLGLVAGVRGPRRPASPQAGTGGAHTAVSGERPVPGQARWWRGRSKAMTTTAPTRITAAGTISASPMAALNASATWGGTVAPDALVVGAVAEVPGR